MTDLLDRFSSSNVVAIALAVLLLLIAIKVLKDIGRPMFLIALAVAGMLVFYGVLDLTVLASTGKKLLEWLWGHLSGEGAAVVCGGICAIMPRIR